MLISEILCTLEMKPIPAFLGGTAPKPGRANRRGHERIDRVQFTIGERLGLDILKADTSFIFELVLVHLKDFESKTLKSRISSSDPTL